MTAPSPDVPLRAPRADPDAVRRVLARATRIGLWVWPSFAALDAWMCFVAYPGAPFPLFVAYRLIGELVLLGVYRASRRGTTRLRTLAIAQNVAFALAATLIALMAVHLGGVRSPYMHGISIVALVRAAAIPARWKRALPPFAAIGLAFPAVMAAGALVSPAARAAWLTGEALTVFASNYVFVLTSCLLGLIIGNMVWTAQEQVFRARRVGRYRLEAPIGRGGMGEVWLAWDLTLRRNIALKLLRVTGGGTPEAVRRFEREAQAASQLHGPHAVRIFDFGASDDGLYYIAMEYLTGTDLGTLVTETGPLPVARAVHFGIQACIALEEAHAAGIIHRDIKPQNLFVTRMGDEPDFLKLLDFGVVRLEQPDGGRGITVTGHVMGTPGFVAPELWWGVVADQRSDIYALGVTLEFLLTGVVPGDPSPPAG
ncbi:MAG TPA: serine/threonine-protein kinase, partial [Gemmatimonadales bacterium]|nr:serine/threonine-protein kinase [Gemmatimonadales bacterium]